MKNGKIIIVDDDETLISTFQTLLYLEGFSNAEFFTKPQKALEYLQDNIPDLIVSDFMMPEMNGLEFLSGANKLYPEVSKILLTGYADKENAIKAINDVGLYKYITKPWDNDDLILNIKNGIERSYLLSRLRQKISELKQAKTELEKYSHNLEDIIKERTADLLESNAKLNGIFANCADGIILVDDAGNIEQVNQACENTFGLAGSSIKKHNLSEIIRSPNKNILENFKSDDSEFFIRDCVIYNSLSETEIPVDISFACITEDKNTRRFVGVMHDITEQKEADKLRDDFIAMLTHDLRTPLLAAIQTIKFFLDGSVGEISEKQRLLLSTMKKSNEDLLGLVNALLEVYKYDAAKLNLCKTDFNFKSLLDQIYSELKPLADTKKIEFKTDYEVDDDTKINADRGEIRRVICNLCGNAINYTNNNGKITITVSRKKNDLIFSVQDNGNGIPPEDIPHLFNRFSQGTSKKRSTGTGLGLYLSRQIIEAHNGKIWLESKLNKGSEFSFLLTNVIVSDKTIVTAK
ncbi:MAG: ATP-binding protein [Candidatus Gastranaerophilales bacterium]|nr:ATP-binding protein [Candidatus Gastranaerophilales bacterium]